MTAETANTIDVRTIVPRERHARIFAQFDALGAGDTMQLVNDHDPRPLYYQLENRAAGTFGWTYLESGPDVWRVRIDKTASTNVAADASGSCCSGGACGG